MRLVAPPIHSVQLYSIIIDKCLLQLPASICGKLSSSLSMYIPRGLLVGRLCLNILSLHLGDFESTKAYKLRKKIQCCATFWLLGEGVTTQFQKNHTQRFISYECPTLS